MQISAFGDKKRHSAVRANTNTLVWTRLIHLLSSTLWSHLNLKTITLETSLSWNTVQALWIVIHSSSVSPWPLNSDPAPRLLPQPQEKVVAPATRKYVSIPFHFSITLLMETPAVSQDSGQSIKRHTLKLAVIKLTQTESAAIPYDRLRSNNTCKRALMETIKASVWHSV